MAEIFLEQNAFVLTRDEKRYAVFKKIFEHYNLPIPEKYFNSHQITGGFSHQNCAYGHVQILKEAKRRKLPYCIIFEDDVFPCDNCYYRFSEFAEELPDNFSVYKFEIAFNGMQSCDKSYSKHLFRKKNYNPRCIGAAAYCVSNRLFDWFIKMEENKNFGIPIDNFLNDACVKDGFITKSPLFMQHNFHNQSQMYGTLYGLYVNCLDYTWLWGDSWFDVNSDFVKELKNFSKQK